MRCDVRANAGWSQYERRLGQLEAISDSLSCLLMEANAEMAPRLLLRLESIDLEMELLRELLREELGRE
jgi:hypothetical protein